MTASLQSFPAVRQLGIRQRSLRRHCRLGRATELVFILATGATLTLAGGAEAQTWDGQTSTSWTTGTNWNTDVVPGAGDTVAVDNGALANQPTVSTNETVAQVVVSAGTLTIASGGTINAPVATSLTGNIVIEAGGTINGSLDAIGATGSNAGTITDYLRVGTGTFTNTGDVLGQTTVNSGTLNLDTGTNLSDSEVLTVSGGTVNVNASEAVGSLSGTGGQVDIASGAVLTAGGDNTSGQYDGAITGDGTFTKTGTGTLTLTGANDPAITSISNGTLAVSGAGTLTGRINGGAAGTLSTDGGALSSSTTIDGDITVAITGDETVGNLFDFFGDIEVNNGADLTATGGTFVLVGGISGDGSITIDGATATFAGLGAKSYTGATNLVSGGLTLNTALASTEVNVSGGILNDNGGALAAGADLTVSGTGTVSINDDETIASVDVQGGTLSGDSPLTVTGTYDQSGGELASGTTVNAAGAKTLEGGTIAGTLGGTGATTVQTGIVTVTGTIDDDVTVASGGTLRLDSATAVSGTITTTGSVISYADGMDEGSAVVLNSNGTQLEVLTGESATQSGVISETGGSRPLEKIGDGTLTLSGSNTYTGTTTVSAGTLDVTGSIASTSVVIDGGTLVVDGSSLLDTAAVDVVSGTLTSTTGDETIGALSGGVGGTVEVGSTVFITSSDTDSTYAGALVGNADGVFSKEGSGTLTFSGDGSAFEGTFGVGVGETELAAGSTLDAAAVGALAGATLTVDGGGILTNANVGVIAEGTINFNGDETVAYLTNNSFNGAGTGTINVNGVGTTLTLAGGTLTSSHDGDITGGAGSGLATTGGTHTLSGTVTIDTIDVGGGSTLVLSGNNSISGITVDGTLRLESDTAAGGAAGQITTTGSVIDYADGVNNATPIEIASNTTQVQVTTGAAEQSGNITEDAAGRPLEKIGDGELLLSGTNSFTGDLTITGGTLAVTGGAAIDDTAEVVVGSGATFRLDSDEDIGALSSAASDATVDVGANQLDIQGAQDTTYAGTMTGTGAVENTGSGRLELTGDGSGFTGVLGATGAGSEIALTGSGTTGATGVGAAAGGTFSTDGGALLASDAVLAADGQVTFTGSEEVGSVTNAAASGIATGTITLTGGSTTLTVNGSASPLNPGGFNGTSGTIDGDGELAITGGTFEVGATGDVQVDTGIASGATVENSGTMADVTNEGTFTNNAGASAGALTNTGAGAGSNAGTLASLTHDSTGIFDNSGSVTGDTSVSDGTLNLEAGSDLSESGTLEVTGGAVNVNTAETVGTLDATGGTVTTNADLTAGALTGASGGSIVTTATGGLIAGDATDSSFGGVISGDGFLQKQGTGTLTLTAANTFTGTTTVDDGTLALTGSGAVVSTTIDINAGGTLATDGGALASSAAVDNEGTFTISGNENIASLDNTGATATTVTSGTLTLNAGVSTLATAVSGAGNLRVLGTSVTTATAANTFTGSTIVNGTGVLNVTGAGTLASTTIDLNTGGTLNTDGGALAVTAEVDNEGTFTITGDESIASLDNTDATATNLNGGNLTLNSGSSTLATAVSGTGGLTVAGGTTDVTAAQTYTGATEVTGGTMNLTGSGALASTDVQVTGTGSLTTDGGGLASGATVLVDDTGVLAVNGTETITTLDQQGGFVNGTGTLNTTGFTQTGGGVVSGTVTVSTSTFEQDDGEIQSGATVAQSTSATLKGGTIAGTLEGAGAVTVETGTTTVTGAITSTDVTVASGELSLDGGDGLADDADLTVNGGLVDVNIDETIATLSGTGGSVDVDAASTLTLGEATADTATYAGAITGAGDLVKQGTSTQELTGANTLSGAVDVTGGTLKVTGAGTLASTDLETAAGAVLETDGGALAADAEVTNAGTLRIAGGDESISTIDGAGNLELNAGGKLTLTGGASAIGGVISGTGTLVLDDAADTTTEGTYLTLSGDSTGFTGETEVTDGTLEITSAATLGSNVTVGTDGVLNLFGVVGGNVTNDGTVNVDGSATIGNDLVNNGTVDMQDGSTGDVLTVSGGVTGSGTYAIDLNLADGTTDQIIGTDATATTLNFDLDATGYGYTGGPVLVFGGVAAGATISDGGVLAGIGGAINYGLQQSGDSVYLVAELDSAIGGVAASAALTQSLIGTIVNRPTSPFVSGLAAEETCSHGGYFRATSGKANVDGGSTAFGNFTPTSLGSSFWGVQGGYDFGCFDGRFFNGWDGAMGVMVGYNAGSTDQMLFSNLSTPTTATGQLTTDFSQDYIGLYLAGGKDRLSADLQLRYDSTSFDISEIAFGSNPEVGLDGASYSTKSTTLGTRLNYRMDVNEAKGINFVPTIGFNVTRVGGDMITLTGGETLELQSYTTFVGFVGGALTQTKIADDGTAATTTFVSGNYYQDFSGDRTALFDLDGAGGSPAEEVSVASIGGFGELSLGVNYVRVLEEGPAGAKQLNASIRADARFGENVSDAYSVTAQVRLSF
jgi:autotransporter-associated beta strand protein